MRNKQASLLALIAVVLGGFGWVAASSGHVAPVQDDGQTIKALLNEVRQLRLVLQRNNVATYRAQVTLERLKLQQTVVSDLMKEQNELHQRLKQAERNLLHHTENAAQYEKLVVSSTNPAERAEREQEAKDLKALVELQKGEIQDLQERAPQLAARIQAEQVKLNELNENLEKLERELENAATDQGKRP